MKKDQTISTFITIGGKKSWHLINFKEIYEYKDLFYFLILRDVMALYKQTILGFTWAIIQPVFSMIVFSIVFGRLAKIPSDGIPYPIFTFAALVPWTYFSSSMTASTNSLISGASIFTKVYFPRLIIPFTPVLSKLVDFGISFIILIGLMIWYNIIPTINILFLPLLIFLMVLTSSGIGMWLSALAIQYRDIRQGIPFLSQLLMYAAPVVWPVSLISDKFDNAGRLFYGLYPMGGVIEGFRSALLGQNPMPWDLICIGFISSSILFFTGAIYFKKKEQIFVDVA